MHLAGGWWKEKTGNIFLGLNMTREKVDLNMDYDSGSSSLKAYL